MTLWKEIIGGEPASVDDYKGPLAMRKKSLQISGAVDYALKLGNRARLVGFILRRKIHKVITSKQLRTMHDQTYVSRLFKVVRWIKIKIANRGNETSAN